ncbi:MAG: hypothetical protein ACO1RT_21265 [Planctomycetaceae bacterium]
MTNSQRLAEVRRCIDRWLETQGVDGDVEMHESVLIRDGFYVGRRFKMSPYQAVWFMEEDEVKIHAADGQTLARLDAAAIDLASRTPAVEYADSSDAADEGVSATIPMARATHGDLRRAISDAGDQEIRRAA